MSDNTPERNQENGQNFRPPAPTRKPPTNNRLNEIGALGNLALNGLAKGLSEIVNAVNDWAERVDAARARADNYDANPETTTQPKPTSLLPNIIDKKPLVTTAPTPLTVREPMVDIFDEEAEGIVVVIIEVPGVSEENIHFEIEGDILIFKTEPDALTASSNTLNNFRYEKEILLPASVEPTPASASYQNGILELRLKKSA